jgi:large conductance mechanosensitive channel
MPPIGLLLGGVDFSNLFVVLGPGTFATLAEATAAGAPALRYGVFLNTVLDFLIVAFAIFLLVRQVNRFVKKKEAAPAAAPRQEVLLQEIRDLLARR